MANPVPDEVSGEDIPVSRNSGSVNARRKRLIIRVRPHGTSSNTLNSYSDIGDINIDTFENILGVTCNGSVAAQGTVVTINGSTLTLNGGTVEYTIECTVRMK